MTQEFKWNRTVFKYSLEIVGKQVLNLPKHPELLCVREQYGSLVLYAEVSKGVRDYEDITIIIIGTGHAVPNENLVYIDTVLTDNGALVWHVYKQVN